jgi:hypothetical protein
MMIAVEALANRAKAMRRCYSAYLTANYGLLMQIR